MTFAQIVTLIKSIPSSAAASSLAYALRAESAAETAVEHGFTLTYSDANSDGNIVITKSLNGN